MVKVWYWFDKNRTEATEVIQQKPLNVDGKTESRKDGQAENSIPA